MTRFREYSPAWRLTPEADVYPALWAFWLPAVVVDEHGVPSHEWVQPFGGYGGGRAFASYWLPRALLYGIQPLLDPEVKPGGEGRPMTALERSFAEAVAEAVEADPEIAAANARRLRVYRKYAADRLPEIFPIVTVGRFVTYRWPSGPEAAGRLAIVAHPDVTRLEFITEAADETVAGEALARCARAHRAVDRAILQWVRRWGAASLNKNKIIFFQ
ncbi:MAG: hypothetical protein KM312_00015 [Hydrogenibacillus schlegelii]|uniref:Uncharacterized protein n=1 Tax=Hydrogenibacillus schlegelii TaxID=1484 RepID=A0A947CWG1_HYDSH|nr:hypothetical protein [Hydrogenibacillus schlegelii]